MSGVADAAHEPQRQRDLRLARQRRVAAGEDEPQPVVGDRLGGVGLSAASGSSSSGSLPSSVRPRRSGLSARRRATVVSHAPGRVGHAVARPGRRAPRT